MASDMPPVYDYIKSLLSMHPPDQKYKQSEFKHFDRKTKCAFAYAYDVTASPESSFIAVLHTDTEYFVCVEFGKEGFKARGQNDGGNYGLMIVVLSGNTVKGIGDKFEFTIPKESGNPSCIAVKDSNLIAISFPDERKISLYNKQGQEQKSLLDLDLIDGLFLISKNCYIYTTLEGIELISDTGKTYKFKTSSTPRAICCDNDGNIYVVVETDEASCNVDCFTRYGTNMGCVVKICGIPHDITLTPSRDLIVAADKSVTTYKVPLPRGMFKCSDGECITCKEHVKESPTFTICYETKGQRPIKSHISCTTRNIIYLITCKKCDFYFVDYTNKPLEEQIATHRTSVASAEQKRNRCFIKHYKQEGHDMVLQGIESFDDSVGLGSRERLWIKKFQTIKYGLNERLPREKILCTPKITPDAGMFKCNENNCNSCEFVKESTFFTSSLPTDKTEHPIRSRITCTTTNVIYLITCKKCNIQYVGQTTQELTERFRKHRSTVNTTTTVTHHFSGEHFIQDMVVQGIESLGENPKPTLIEKKKEYWNNELETVEFFNTLIRDATLMI